MNAVLILIAVTAITVTVMLVMAFGKAIEEELSYIDEEEFNSYLHTGVYSVKREEDN